MYYEVVVKLQRYVCQATFSTRKFQHIAQQIIQLLLYCLVCLYIQILILYLLDFCQALDFDFCEISIYSYIGKIFSNISFSREYCIYFIK